ncbi:hypothetical protein IV102_37490 [bacterium]|nr:hypothetical protein [bacterium]
MENLGLFLLACGCCGFALYAGTRFLMHCRRRDFKDPAGRDAHQAGRKMGQTCFLLTLMLSLGVWAWVGHHIVAAEFCGWIRPLERILYLAGCLLPLIGLAGSCVAWVWTSDPPSRPQPNDYFTRC